MTEENDLLSPMREELAIERALQQLVDEQRMITTKSINEVLGRKPTSGLSTTELKIKKEFLARQKQKILETHAEQVKPTEDSTQQWESSVPPVDETNV